MVILKNIRRFNILVIILLFPVLVFLFLVGWMLYNAGASKNRREKQPANAPEIRTLGAIFLEEQLEHAH